jgi:methionine-S-sulfoxide reductase
MRLTILMVLLVIFMLGCKIPSQEQRENPNLGRELPTENYKIATFAGGCFWCIEAGFQEQDGVYEVISGYTGGDVDNPSYRQVTSGNTGHFEAVQVYYDPSKLTFSDLIDMFWIQIDPTDDGGQFADRGPQYRTAIFYNDEEEKKIAEQKVRELDESGKFDEPIVTEVLPAGEFFKAEEYHQDYYLKQSGHYDRYKVGSGRAGFIEKVWK